MHDTRKVDQLGKEKNCSVSVVMIGLANGSVLSPDDWITFLLSTLLHIILEVSAIE